jgi:glycerophosphoryl diester phosphodiesterase
MARYGRRRRPVTALWALTAALACAPAAQAAQSDPRIQAHRGGSYLNGEPVFAENSLPAFENAAANGWVLEFDVHLTADGTPVVIHDATLDRTTACTGLVEAKRVEEIRTCPIDVLGSPGSALDHGRVAPEDRVPIPTLEQVLDLAQEMNAPVSIEIKNIPTDLDPLALLNAVPLIDPANPTLPAIDPAALLGALANVDLGGAGFDPTLATARKITAAIKASGIAQDQVVIQSFWPPNLVAAQQEWPGVATALLTLPQFDDAAPASARALSSQWVSPAWPTSATAIDLSHQLGRSVVPYTLDTAGAVTDAAKAGVDALITDDPAMAQQRLDELAGRAIDLDARDRAVATGNYGFDQP